MSGDQTWRDNLEVGYLIDCYDSTGWSNAIIT